MLLSSKHGLLYILSIASMCLLSACAPPDSGDNTTPRQQATAKVVKRELAHPSLTIEHKATPLTPEQLKLANGFEGADFATSITLGKSGGTIIVGTFGEGPKDLNPITANDSASNDVNSLMYSGLIGYSMDTQDYQPGLLTEWVMSDTDKRDWKLTLRKGLLWSDGQPITADDLIFTVQTIYDPKIVNPAKDILKIDDQPIAFTKLDDVTVSATIAKPSASMPMLLASITVLPKHKLAAAVENGTFDSVLNIDAIPENIVCSGPFKLKLIENGQRVILERNPNYYRFDEAGTRLPYLDTIILSYSADQDSQLLSFKAGQTDAFVGPRPQSVPDLIDDQKKGNYTVYDCGTGDGASVFWFNLKQGKNAESGKPYVEPGLAKIFAEPDFRKACLYAIDKDSIIATELRGLSTNARSLVSPALKFWHNPDIPKYEFDPQKAEQLLDGLKLIDRDNDGIRESEDGTKLSFVFMTNKGNKVRENIGALISNDLRRVGIDAKLQTLEFNTLVTLTGNTYEYEACSLGFGGSIHPANSMNLYLSSGRTHFWDPCQEKPSTEWEKRVDDLCRDFNTTLDTTEQQRTFYEVQKIVAEQCPYLPLFSSKVFVVARNKFGNLRPSPFSPELLWNVEELFIETENKE